jgi:hypothetical protein
MKGVIFKEKVIDNAQTLQVINPNVEGHLNLCACAGKLSYENQGNAFS